MSNYNEAIDAIELFEGVDPITGVSHNLFPDAYAAYADIHGLEVDAESFSDWRRDAEDAYQGEYSSDEDFAQELADELGLINSEMEWPYSCIDWARAARELMFDYDSSHGVYFRS